MLKRIISLIVTTIMLLSLTVFSIPAQAGDGVLDGLDEAVLIARYLFDGNTDDWSRNAYNATLFKGETGEQAGFVEDGMFGTVLSLPGGRNNNYVKIPGEALVDVTTISVAGWVYCSSNSSYVRFFDFGQDTSKNFWCSTYAGSTNSGYRTRITVTGSGGEFGPRARRISNNAWVHLASVLDTTNKTLSIYKDGEMVAQTTDVELTIKDVLNQTNPAANLLYIGKSMYADSDFGGMLYDFRVYNTALTEENILTIRNNALTEEVKINSDINGINLGTLTNRVENITLPEGGSFGSSFTWSSDKPEFVSIDGTVTRPPNTYEEDFATVTLTVTAKINETTGTKDFTVTVPRLPTDAEIVATDKTALDLGNISALTKSITLPGKGGMGSDISWATDNSEHISVAGEVVRPTAGQPDASFKLTATITYGNATDTKEFTGTIPAMPTDKQIVDADVEAIELGNLVNLTTNLTLPTQSASGYSTISWASDREDVITSTGVITRPSFEIGTQTATLTVTATRNDEVATKQFTVTILRLPNAPILIEVPDIVVETSVGYLPHLPFYVPGIYKNGTAGPLVRVNWPSPTNNQDVSAVGTYTLEGVVADTDFTPVATVLVRPRSEGVNVFHHNSEFFNIETTFKYEDEIAVKLEPGRTLTTSIKADNISGTNIDTILIAALYDPLNMMVSETHISKNVELDGSENLVVNILLPEDVEGYKVKVFVWKGLDIEEAINPLSGVVQISDVGVDYRVEGPELSLEAFHLGDIQLIKQDNGDDSQFAKNRDKFFTGLMNSNPDSFLYMFRDAFNEPQLGPALGGWDTQTTKLRGHATGHYLTALSQAYASATYDPTIRENLGQKLDYMIDNLYAMAKKSGKPVTEGGQFNADPTTVPFGPGKTSYNSDLTTAGIRHDFWNWGEGFISAYPPDQFIMLEQGATYSSGNNNIWAPYYTLHKILAGLLDCYEITGNEKALEIATGMGIWVYKRLNVIPEATLINMWDRYIAGEYGGMNEVMARLYSKTGDKRFLEGAMLFDNISLFYGNRERTGGLAKNVDTFRGHHANQHIPQINGAIKTYDASGDVKYFDIAENFWNMSYNSYTYSIGGVAGSLNNAEAYTAQPNSLYKLGFHTSGQNETCATYNLLKLTRSLFMYEQEGQYMDYYEQALYNHILSSVAENNAGNTYHVPLNPGSSKGFGNAGMTGFTCCNGTAIESSTKLQDTIYFKSIDDSALYVNLYVPSILNWKSRNVTLTQNTNFPYDDNTMLTIGGGGEFEVNVRVPSWATKGFIVKINGEEQTVEAVPGTYLSLNRTWSDGDIIELEMPFHFYLKPLMDKPNIASIFYGPVLLAVQESGSLTAWRKVEFDAGDIGLSITGDPQTLEFMSNGVSLKPFFLTYGRHSVYLDVTLN